LQVLRETLMSKIVSTFVALIDENTR